MTDQPPLLARPGTRLTSFRRGALTFHAAVAGTPADEPIVLLHGFPGSVATWDAVSDVVVAAGYSTVALQQRGYDADARPRHVSAYRLPQLAADVEALVDHLGATRCHLVGHDWGGIVAWYLAATRPQRCASLTVLSTPHPRAFAASMVRSAQALRSTYAVAFQLPLLPELALTADRGAVLRTSLVASGLDAATARRYADGLADRRAMRAALHWYRASFRHPGDARAVGRITVPTTYAWSTGDTALDRAGAERTGAHVDGPYRFVVLDGVPHWIPEREPERTADLILERVAAAA